MVKRADFLRPGIRFSVQPGDTVERGLGTRLKQVKGSDGKPEYRIQSKGNIEVVEVVGPHLSIARITPSSTVTLAVRSRPADGSTTRTVSNRMLSGPTFRHCSSVAG